MHSESELFSSSKNPISFGVSEPFSITETTRSLSIKLNIFPNGAPGIVGQLVSGNTSDTGETAEIQVFLGTPPKKTVTFPISSKFKNLSNISVDNLTFSPSDWYIPKTFKITGSTERLIRGNVIYQLEFGPAKSTDEDYEGLKSILDLTHLDKTLPSLTSISTTSSRIGSEFLGIGDEYIITLNSNESLQEPIIYLNVQ